MINCQWILQQKNSSQHPCDQDNGQSETGECFDKWSQTVSRVITQAHLSFYGSATDWNHVEWIIYLIYKST